MGRQHRRGLPELFHVKHRQDEDRAVARRSRELRPLRPPPVRGWPRRLRQRPQRLFSRKRGPARARARDMPSFCEVRPPPDVKQCIVTFHDVRAIQDRCSTWNVPTRPAPPTDQVPSPPSSEAITPRPCPGSPGADASPPGSSSANRPETRPESVLPAPGAGDVRVPASPWPPGTRC